MKENVVFFQYTPRPAQTRKGEFRAALSIREIVLNYRKNKAMEAFL